MIHVMKKIADWLFENEKKDALDCTISDEIIDEWLNTIDKRKNSMEKSNHTDTGQYEMLSDLDKRVRGIKKIREEKCHDHGKDKN